MAQRPDPHLAQPAFRTDSIRAPNRYALNDVPGQLRVAAREIVQPFARVEQLLFLLIADPPIAAPLVLRNDSKSAPMERVALSRSRPIGPAADVTESSQVPIGRRNCPTGATRLEVLDCFGALKSRCR
jgi:hypothetical protein